MQNQSPDIGDPDDEVQCVNADGSPYGRGTTNSNNNATHLLKPRAGEKRPPPAFATPITTPRDTPPKRRQPHFPTPAYGPSQTPGSRLTDNISTRNTRNKSSLNGSRPTGPKGWGHMTELSDGIKAPKRNRNSDTLPAPKGGFIDERGKFHIPIQSVSQKEMKRQRDVIDVDDDESASKKPRRKGPTGTKSPHFPHQDLPHQDLLPQSTFKSSLLDDEASRRGFSLDDPFSRTYAASPTLADDIAKEMKGAAQKIQYPGQGNKRRELVQDKLRDPVQSYISRGGSISTEGKSSAPVEFQLSWIMKGSAKFEGVLAKMYSEKIDFFSLPGEWIETIQIRKVDSVKCDEGGKMWVIFSSQKDTNFIMDIKDKDISIAANALQNAFGGIVDRVENQRFYARYLTESERQESPIPRLQPMVLITNRGKDVPHQLDFLDDRPRENSKKGSLEQLPSSSPQMEISVPARPEPNPRRELVARRRQDIDEKSTKERISRNPTTPTLAPRRATRSQSALVKHIPVLQYPMTAAKKKVTLYPDDVNRLSDEEFLNDSIIEFYLLYILDHLPASTREKTHFFNTFFWTNLTRKSAAGKRGYENVKKWTSKVDIFSKEYIVIPVNEAAHWYVAIICNLDKAKPKKDSPRPKPPRTRSRIESLSSDEIDVEDNAVDLATPRIIVEETDQDNEVVLNSQPTNSRDVTPQREKDVVYTGDGSVEVVSVEMDVVPGDVKQVDVESANQTDGLTVVQAELATAPAPAPDSVVQTGAMPALDLEPAPVQPDPLPDSETSSVAPKSDTVPTSGTTPMEVDIPEPTTQPEPLSVPEPNTDPAPQPIANAPSAPVLMELDSPEQIEKDLREMTISGNLNSESKEYDFQNDDSITEIDRMAIENAMTGQGEIRYSRRKSAARKEDPITLQDEEEEPISITAALRKKYRPAAAKSPARRSSTKIIPPDSPVIIVFDSLGLKHVPTIKALRDYLVEEAKAKRDMDIAKEDIVGMHAKVPTQSNYCDCGVFLLHYVERFLAEPDLYLRDILGRGMDTSEPEDARELWRSGEVKEKRAQMRHLIRGLSEEYKHEKQKKDAEIKAQKEKEEKEKAEEDAKTGDEIPLKPIETPTQTTETKQPDTPTRRRKQLHPTKLLSSDDGKKVILVD